MKKPMAPNSWGKGPVDYIEEAVTRLDRTTFEQNLRKFLGSKLASKLGQENVQALFEISDEYCRQYDGVVGMNNDGLMQDWKHRAKLIGTLQSRLEAIQAHVKVASATSHRPATARLARFILRKIVKFQNDLSKEFEELDVHQRASKILMRLLSLGGLRGGYVAELDHYVTNSLSLLKKEVDVLIAGTMVAAKEFPEHKKGDDVVARIAMARSRARREVASLDIPGINDGPCFPTRPRIKRDTS
jgi:hypothetical protein